MIKKKIYHIPTIETIQVQFPIWMDLPSSTEHGAGGGGHAPQYDGPVSERSSSDMLF